MAEFDGLTRSFHAHFTRDAKQRLYCGVDRNLDELTDPGRQEMDAKVEEARGLVSELDAVSRGALSFDQNLDLDLARLMLEAEVHELTYEFNGRTASAQRPTAADDIGDPLFQMFVLDPRPVGDRLSDITSCIEGIPEYLQALLGRLEVPVRRWVGIEVEQVRGLPDLFSALNDWGRREGWSDADRLRAACDRAQVALTDYVGRLRDLPVTDHFHLGSDCARRILDLSGIEMSFEELHRMASDFLVRMRSEIGELTERLVKKHGLVAGTTPDELHRFLAKRYRVELSDGDLDQIVRRYEEERERILTFIEDRNLFPILDDQDMRILRTPKFMEPQIPAGAMTAPPPFREGTRRSLVYLTLSEELLDEHTELTVPGMMLHEGIPGHHLQLATAAAHPSVVRRHVDARDLAEGWTTMLEDYMLDVGYAAEIADEVRFVGKRDISRLGARVAIDLFFMTGDRKYLEVGVDCDLSSDDPFVAAGHLLRTVTGFVPERVQAELNWYSTERAYPLSYLTGNTLVWKLKRDLIEAQKGKLEGLDLDREFHRVYLHAGNMPVSYLRRVFENEGLLG